MADREHDLEVDEAALAVVARHALHDEELIAAFAADATESEDDAVRARGLVERCVACRDLHADLQGIGAALRFESQARIAAPRDFRLSVEDARRLGGTILSRGFLARLRRSMDSFARPVGASMATLGIVGLLVGNITLGGSAASAPGSVDTGQAATAAPGAVGGTIQASPAKSTARTTAFEPEATSFEAETDGEGPRDNFVASGPAPSALLFGGSVVLLIAGVALLLLSLRRGRRER